MLFYCVMKTKGDIMVDLQQFNLAIIAYKRLKGECERWGGKEMHLLKMKMFE